MLKITPENFAELITLLYGNQLSSSAGLKILEEMAETGADPSHIMEEKQLGQMGDKDELENLVNNVIKNNPKQVEEYKSGKIQIIQFMMGIVMKETEGRANPKIVIELLKKNLK